MVMAYGQATGLGMGMRPGPTGRRVPCALTASGRVTGPGNGTENGWVTGPVTVDGLRTDDGSGRSQLMDPGRAGGAGAGQGPGESQKWCRLAERKENATD